MEGLRLDSARLVNTGSFEEWASDLGLDADSRRAQRMYQATVRNTAELRALLGEDFDGIVFGADGLCGGSSTVLHARPRSRGRSPVKIIDAQGRFRSPVRGLLGDDFEAIVFDPGTKP